MLKQHRYWLAGILEGEGQFGSYGYGQKPQLRVSMVSTDKDIVVKVAHLMKARSVRVNRSRNRLGKKCQWRTDIYSMKALSIMRLLKPLMGQRRRKQIMKSISRWRDY